MSGRSRLARTLLALAVLIVLLGIQGSLVDLVRQHNASTVPLAQIGVMILVGLPGVYAIRQGRDLIFRGFAGLVLMVGRPYRIGAAIRLRSSQVGAAEYEGTVVDMNALYTKLRTASGELLHLPNSAVVSSAMVVGRPPLQARIEAELPPGTALEPLRVTLEERLELPPSTVTVVPSKLQAGPDAKLTCSIEVRASGQVEPGLLADALAGALATLAPVHQA